MIKLTVLQTIKFARAKFAFILFWLFCWWDTGNGNNFYILENTRIPRIIWLCPFRQGKRKRKMPTGVLALKPFGVLSLKNSQWRYFFSAILRVVLSTSALNTKFRGTLNKMILVTGNILYLFKFARTYSKYNADNVYQFKNA